jgi:hypothetical protein
MNISEDSFWLQIWLKKSRQNWEVHSLIVGSIDEIAPSLKESVQELEAGCFVHGSEADGSPGVSNAHGSKNQWRNMDGSMLGQSPITPESSWWRWCCGEKTHPCSDGGKRME